MFRTLTALVLIAAIGCFACYAQSDSAADQKSKEGIAALEQQRIKLLEDRVLILRELVAANQVSRTEIRSAEMEVTNARLDYASSGDEQRTLLTNLISLYDEQIEVAVLLVDRPVMPGTSSRSRHAATLDLLFLKSERLRVQIERARLDQ